MSESDIHTNDIIREAQEASKEWDELCAQPGRTPKFQAWLKSLEERPRKRQTLGLTYATRR